MLALTILKSPILEPLTGTVYRITSVEPILIGRHSSAQIRIVHPFISRRHFKLTPLNKSWCLQHMSSKNPTIVNGEVVEDFIELKYGDKIRIGPFMIEISAMTWAKNAVEVTEPVIDDALSQSEAEATCSDEDEATMLMEFESLND
jgi:predicted component of type VI protein secretion system